MHPPVAGFRENLRGIGAMLVASFCFIVNDALVKLANDHLPTGEILFLRGLVSLVLVGGIAAAVGALRPWRLLATRAVGLRTVGEIGGTLTYLSALFHMPIANSTTVMQAVPLAATAGAALVFGEKVGWRRWTAIAVGFVGVMIVVRPGFGGFDYHALFALVAVLFVTLRDLSTRAIGRAVPTLLVTAFTCLALALVGAAMGLREDWVMPESAALAEIVGAAIALSGGFSFVIIAMRTGDLSVVAPFRYLLIVWATIVGFLVWKDRPDALDLIGSAIIIAAGPSANFRSRWKV